MRQVSGGDHVMRGASVRQALDWGQPYLLYSSVPCERAIVKTHSLPGADAP
ncbi:MAG TPA: hypothetical protein VF812_00375 [Ktedonobacterales bacterium]